MKIVNTEETVALIRRACLAVADHCVGPGIEDFGIEVSKISVIALLRRATELAKSLPRN